MCLFRKPSKDYFEGRNVWRREPGGGVVLINLILRNICGDIVAIQAAESNAARGFVVEDTAAMIVHFANGALGTLTISDAANAPWSWELTSGENKAYPHTDQFCYLVSGIEGSVTIPRLDFWRHDGDGWWTLMNTERSIVPEQDPLTLRASLHAASSFGERSRRAAPACKGFQSGAGDMVRCSHMSGPSVRCT